MDTLIQSSPSGLLTGAGKRFEQHCTTLPHLTLLYALFFGAIGPLAFAPFSWWWVYSISIGGLYTLLNVSVKAARAGWVGFCYGLGFFGVGISWVNVSIDSFGQVGTLGALGVTFALVALMSAYWHIGARLYWRLKLAYPSLQIFLFISLWLAAEWLRGTLFTGFPWLLPGYSTHASWLFEWSSIGGIWLTSALAVFTGIGVTHLLFVQMKRLIIVLIVAIWVTPATVDFDSFSKLAIGKPVQVTLVQGNVPQDQKWLPQNAASSLSYYQQATIANLESDLVVWPETAITYLQDQVVPYLAGFDQELTQTHTTVITGVPTYDNAAKTYYNSVWALGNGFGLYNKQRLVPFGEYIPLSNLFGPVFDLFGMPMSQFSLGESNQPTLQAGEYAIAPFVCYEIVYPELMRSMVRDSDLLLTISNDGWFGDSIGPWQHLEIAQFRAKEMGRFMIRATNTGVSAIIDHHGEIQAQIPQFVRTTLTSTATPITGVTPYVTYGALPFAGFMLLLFGVCAISRFAARRQPSQQKWET